MVKILTDSCADLNPEFLNEHDLDVIDLQVFIDQKTYLDRELSQDELFHLVKMSGEFPKTSARSISDYEKFFSPYDEIIYISIGSKLSASYQSAVIAANNLPEKNIRIVDTHNLSTGIALLALKAVELINEDKSIDQITATIQELIPKVRTSFIINSLDFLYKGGRCSAMENIMGSLLQIHPVIEVRQDGTLGVKEKVRGSQKKSFQALLNDLQKNKEKIDSHRVFITHTGTDVAAQNLADEVQQLIAFDHLHITRAGNVISSHCGPETYGLLYLLK